MNINNEKLKFIKLHNIRLQKPYLSNVLTEFFKNEDKAQRAVEHILDNRSRVEKKKLKRVGEKKKNLTIEE